MSIRSIIARTLRSNAWSSIWNQTACRYPHQQLAPIRLDLDVKGLGRWQHELSICVPKEEVRRPSWDELMAGPFLQTQS